MRRSDDIRHARGESLFMDDVPLPAGCVHLAVLGAPIAHGELLGIDDGAARSLPGVHRIFTAADIPGENQVGGIILDEELLAAREIHYFGQPLAFVAADSPAAARAAVQALRPLVEARDPLLCPREAARRGAFIVPPRTFACGDVDSAWRECDLIVGGRVESGAQEHVYLETQGSIAFPEENGRIRLLAGTQSPSSVQRITARVLGKRMNEVTVEVVRLGGGFGGKEDQATPWAAMAAMAAAALGRPAKIVLERGEDMVMTGKRHAYSSDFSIGLRRDGTILAYEAVFYQNAGAAADLSPAILERTLFHGTGSYFIPHVRMTALSCRTNIAPATAFRGFGAPQGVLVVEAAITRAAEVLGVAPEEIRRCNLLKDGDHFPFGMEVRNSRAARCWREAEAEYDWTGLCAAVQRFNAGSRLVKKGVSIVPICFGISFTNTTLNQAGSLVHIYTDGSVSVSTGAVEMGQGVNHKILLTVARELGVAPEGISVESTHTRRVANMSPTAASSGADLNAMAATLACRTLLERLRPLAAELLGVESSRADEVTVRDGLAAHPAAGHTLPWAELVRAAYLRRISLSAQAYYATPGIFFDKGRERGTPFAYHVFGCAVTEVTLDILRGVYSIDSVRIVHDAGRSIDPAIDRGQVEGALVQGIGWLTIEEWPIGPDGLPTARNLAAYKVPDLPFAPAISLRFLADADNPHAVSHSKGIGEPPFLYGLGAFFALRRAMQAFGPERELPFSAPLTPEKVLLALHHE